MGQYGQTSSGRWDAAGSWDEAVRNQENEAMRWASDLDDEDISDLLEAMVDSNEFTTYERRALLLVAARKLRPKPKCKNCSGSGTISISVVHPTNPILDTWDSAICGSCNGKGCK